jgi:hypothetical protein
LATFGEAHVFFGLADLEGGFFTATAAFVEVDGFFEGFFTLGGERCRERLEREGVVRIERDNEWLRHYTRHGRPRPPLGTIHAFLDRRSK